MKGRSSSALAGAGLLAALMPAWAGSGLHAQAARAEIAAGVDSIARAPIEAGEAAGMAIAAVRGTDTLVLAAYGSADLELGVPMPVDAVFEIGSVTKQFTAAAVLLLQEEGKLSLDDDLTDWLPDYPAGGRGITIRRLLDHTSGIKGYTEMPVFRTFTTQELPRDSLVALFAAEPFDFEPGEALIYNNSAYFLLGLVIEAASGESYEDFVETRLFAAAGMDDSRYCHKDELVPNRAEGYQPGRDGLRPADYLDHLWPYAAGSLCSTVRDLVAWNQALHGDGEGGDLLSPDSYRELITPGTLADGTPVRYAKGLGITLRDGRPRIGHGGGIFGYVSELRYLPDEDLTIAVLINTSGRVSPGKIANRIEELVLGPPAPVRPRVFTGDLDRYTGTFRGPGRGRRLNVTVAVDDDGRLAIRLPPDPAEPVDWLGGDTFGSGDRRFTFRREGGEVVELRVDTVGGHYVLRRVSR
ncbi:MAG: serine hydrolase domain-containing protein [Gemmatimonadota bacterium]|nr:serine hydrolase domain-containing protein [Gemmatimonadota bacterium]